MLSVSLFDQCEKNQQLEPAQELPGIGFTVELPIQVSEDEWAAIPEVGDARNRKQRLAGLREKYTPMSDAMLAR